MMAVRHEKSNAVRFFPKKQMGRRIDGRETPFRANILVTLCLITSNDAGASNSKHHLKPTVKPQHKIDETSANNSDCITISISYFTQANAATKVQSPRSNNKIQFNQHPTHSIYRCIYDLTK